MEHNTIQWNTIQYNGTQYNKKEHNAMQYSTYVTGQNLIIYYEIIQCFQNKKKEIAN